MSGVVRRLSWLCFGVLGLASLYMTWRALSFGTGGNDESYYIISGFRYAFGDVPFLNVMEATAFSLIYTPIIYAYKVFFGNIDGVFLFLRRSYFVFTLISCFLIYKSIFRSVGVVFSLFIALSVFVYSPWSLHTFNYNNFSVYFSLMSFLFFYRGVAVGRHRCLWLFLSGMMLALCAVAYPGYMVFAPLMLFGGYIARRRFLAGPAFGRILLAYVCGGLVISLCVVGYLSKTSGGFAALLGNIRFFLANMSQNPDGIGIAKLDPFLDGLRAAKVYWISLAVTLPISVFGSTQLRRWQILPDVDWRSGVRFGTTVSLIIFIVTQILLLPDKLFLTPNVCFVGFISGALYFSCLTKRRAWQWGLFFALWGSAAIMMLVALCGSWIGFYFREYLLVGGALFAIVVCVDSEGDRRPGLWSQYGTQIYPCVVGGFLVLGLLMGHRLWVYGDAERPQLTERYTFGPYRGLYSLPQSIAGHQFIADVIKRETNENDYLINWDIAPITYTFSSGRVCAPSSWNGLEEYTKGYSRTYQAFVSKGLCRPTKIIALSFRAIGATGADGAADEYAQQHGYRLITDEHQGEVRIKIFSNLPE